jgi:hypothetical protein
VVVVVVVVVVFTQEVFVVVVETISQCSTRRRSLNGELVLNIGPTGKQAGSVGDVCPALSNPI